MRIFLFAVLSLLAFNVTSSSQAQGVKKHRTFSTQAKRKKHAKGFKKSIESDQKMQASPHLSFLKELAPIPRKVDLSPWVSLPEDQGQCGCCWDFSLTKALRSEYMLAGIDPGKLEFNYLLDNCGRGPSMAGCDGGSFVAAESFESSEGPGLNALNPFSGSTHACMKQPVRATAISHVMLGAGREGPTFKDLAYAIGVKRHMLSIDVAAGSGDWESYAGGVYNDCAGGANDIDHMINMVGFDCQTSVDAKGNCVFDSKGRLIHHDELVLIQNNWSENWGVKAANGHGGYMWMHMYAENGKKCNAIANDALMFVIDPKPVPPEAPHSRGIFCSLLGLGC